MSEIADSKPSPLPEAKDDAGLQVRIRWTMALSVAFAVLVSMPIAPWRVTTGLLLGGALSLFNYHWMRSSIAALISARAEGRDVSAKVLRYIVRYFVIATIVFAAYELKLISLPATIAGLCSFVVAILVEAFREFYFAIVHREEIS